MLALRAAMASAATAAGKRKRQAILSSGLAALLNALQSAGVQTELEPRPDSKKGKAAAEATSLA